MRRNYFFSSPFIHHSWMTPISTMKGSRPSGLSSIFRKTPDRSEQFSQQVTSSLFMADDIEKVNIQDTPISHEGYLVLDIGKAEDGCD